MSNRFDQQQLRQAREDHQRWRDQRAEIFARISGQPEDAIEEDLLWPSDDQGSTITSWTITVADLDSMQIVLLPWQAGTVVMATLQGPDGTVMAVMATADVQALEPVPIFDPRLEPVDIIDKIDEVLAEEDHPEHIDALVNWQLGRGER